ncbi:DUF2799 domain-containing protein [Breoghania sp. L-A4]|uniref:DUF2799 domain-containing protein n=1 Tax=Breoghania sp. L-A4 TaxID=2304600 RepID=UPI000E35E110|nr:DUF2799 domain-containing protein [Breoghania sp. L-A4]AXS39192.1 DUF2799 domain-containing protein [Breoghania sp. L-A4]
MNSFARLALIALALPLLSSCASLTPEQCETGNWRTIGLSDGAEGRPLSRLDDHREACGKVGISIDTGAYMAGRDEGLTRYCTPVSGFSVGSNGRANGNVCPAELAGGFEAGYVLGSELHAAQSALTQAENALRRAESAESATEDRMRDLRAAMVSEQDRDKRRAIGDELRRLRDTARDQQRQVRRADRERRDRQHHLDIVREDSFAQLRLLAPGWAPGSRTRDLCPNKTGRWSASAIAFSLCPKRQREDIHGAYRSAGARRGSGIQGTLRSL